jgi:hypothetical protein
MAAGRLTTAARDAVLNAIFRGVALGVPATWHLCAFTADPGASGSLVSEVSGNNYVRVPITVNVSNFLAAASGGANNARLVESAAAFEFAAATGGGWGTITHLGLNTASSVGVLWVTYELAAPQLIGATNVLRAAAGDLDFSLRDV